MERGTRNAGGRVRGEGSHILVLKIKKVNEIIRFALHERGEKEKNYGSSNNYKRQF